MIKNTLLITSAVTLAAAAYTALLPTLSFFGNVLLINIAHTFGYL